MRITFLVLSLVVLVIGFYLKFVYDVPDGQEAINSFTSGFLMIVGISSLLINALWKKPRPPLRDQE
jgi:hypothetical protein